VENAARNKDGDDALIYFGGAQPHITQWQLQSVAYRIGNRGNIVFRTVSNEHWRRSCVNGWDMGILLQMIAPLRNCFGGIAKAILTLT